MIARADKPFDNAGSNPNGEMHRTGGSLNDPHGGYENVEGGRPDPDPIQEMATIDGDSQDNRPDRPHLKQQAGPQSGFGPRPDVEKLVGNPELGIDPRDTADAWVTGTKAPEPDN